jgi:hypothetical protein
MVHTVLLLLPPPLTYACRYSLSKPSVVLVSLVGISYAHVPQQLNPCTND